MPGEKTATFSIIVMLAIAAVYLYFFVYLPTQNPDLQRPVLAEGEKVGTVHLDWLVRQLGAGTLHRVTGSAAEPQIEIVVTPGNERFTVTVMNGVPRTTAGAAISPDIRISGERDVVARLLLARDVAQEANRLYAEGKIRFDLLKDTPQLAAMGYSALYNDLTSEPAI